MTRHTLTARQRAVLRFIAKFIDERHYAPTIREIGDYFGIVSPNGVMGHLKYLVRKGFIGRDANTARGIWIIKEA